MRADLQALRKDLAASMVTAPELIGGSRKPSDFADDPAPELPNAHRSTKDFPLDSR